MYRPFFTYEGTSISHVRGRWSEPHMELGMDLTLTVGMDVLEIFISAVWKIWSTRDHVPLW